MKKTKDPSILLDSDFPENRKYKHMLYWPSSVCIQMYTDESEHKSESFIKTSELVRFKTNKQTNKTPL